MGSSTSNLATAVSVGGSLLFHAALVGYLAVAPSASNALPPLGKDSGFELALDAPTPAATTPPPAPSSPPIEPPKPEDLAKPPPPETPAPPPPPQEEPKELDPDRIKIGIDSSNAPKNTKAFLGSDKPTTLQAPTSTVEQPALTPEPGRSGTNGLEPTPNLDPPVPDAAPKPAANPTPEQPPSPPAPMPEAPAAPAEAPAGPPAPPTPSPPAAPGPESPPQERPPSPGINTDASPTPGTTPDTAANPDGRVRAAALLEDLLGQLPIVTPGGGLIYIPPRPAQPHTAPPPAAPSAAPAPSPAPNTPAPTGAPGATKARDGDRSIKESTAFTLKKTLEYRRGDVLAAEGMDITTVDPEISILSNITGSIRNPTITLRFGPDGRVKHATFKDGLSTGRKDWDEPILHALHRWTLGGKKFSELIAESPTREIIVHVRLLLR